MLIGEKIKAERKNRKLTQKQLAEATNVAIGTIQQYELGKRAPRLEILAKIADALNVQIGDLLPSQPGAEYELDYDHPPQLQRQFILEEAFRKLNDEGQQKAVERVQELTEIQRYQAKKESLSDAFGNLFSEIPETRENFISALAMIPDEGLPIIADHIVSVCRDPKAYLAQTEEERVADTKRLAEQVIKLLEENNET